MKRIHTREKVRGVYSNDIFLILVLSMGIIRISSATNIKVKTGFTFDWWKSNADNGLEAIEGSQFYIPIRIGTQHKELSFDILTGYSTTNVDLSDGGSKSLSSVLDTKINCAYEISGKLPNKRCNYSDNSPLCQYKSSDESVRWSGLDNCIFVKCAVLTLFTKASLYLFTFSGFFWWSEFNKTCPVGITEPWCNYPE